MKKAIYLTLALLASSLFANATDFWETSFKAWTYEETETILSNSPWAGTGSTSQQSRVNQRRNTGEEENIDLQYTVRLFSALPIRQGYVRMFQFINKYGEMSQDEQKSFDQKVNRALQQIENEVIVNLDLFSEDQRSRIETDRRLKQIRVEQLKQSAFLITDSYGRVEITKYQSPSPDGTGAKFVFPRTINGQELLSPDDTKVIFELWIPGTNFRIKHSWKIADMKINEELVY